MMLDPARTLPDDGCRGALAGRVWRPDCQGPSVVAVREDGVFDRSAAFRHRLKRHLYGAAWSTEMEHFIYFELHAQQFLSATFGVRNNLARRLGAAHDDIRTMLDPYKQGIEIHLQPKAVMFPTDARLIEALVGNVLDRIVADAGYRATTPRRNIASTSTPPAEARRHRRDQARLQTTRGHRAGGPRPDA